MVMITPSIFLAVVRSFTVPKTMTTSTCDQAGTSASTKAVMAMLRINLCFKVLVIKGWAWYRAAEEPQFRTSLAATLSACAATGRSAPSTPSPTWP